MRGPLRRHYPPQDYCTPYEKLISLPGWSEYLKPGITAEWLRQQASRISDTDAALRMQRAKTALLRRCRFTRTSAPPGF